MGWGGGWGVVKKISWSTLHDKFKFMPNTGWMIPVSYLNYTVYSYISSAHPWQTLLNKQQPMSNIVLFIPCFVSRGLINVILTYVWTLIEVSVNTGERAFGAINIYLERQLCVATQLSHTKVKSYYHVLISYRRACDLLWVGCLTGSRTYAGNKKRHSMEIDTVNK